MGRFLKLYTELPVEECDRLGALPGSEINQAKITLANEVTKLAHGVAAAEAAEATAKGVFVNHLSAQGINAYSEVSSPTVGTGLPRLELTAADVTDGISLAQLFLRSGLASSGKEAKRLITEGGARVNDAVVTEPGQMFGAAELAEPLKLTAGKKRHALVVLS